MNSHGHHVRLLAMLLVVVFVRGCGDGDSPTAPPPQLDPPRPTTVTVSPAAAELTALRATVQLTAEVRDQNDRVMSGMTVTWSSSDTSVAMVAASGLVTGITEGVAVITASAGEASGSAEVTVMQPVALVEVAPVAETVGLGSTLQLTAVGFDENGDTVESAEFSWESSNAAVATVNASGLVTGVAEGMATVTASAGSGKGTAEITVVDLERTALVALYEAADGPNWVNSENWLTDAPIGDWYGVDTDASGRVVGLDLDGRWDSDAREWIPHGLLGPIPPELGNLTSLTRLDLDHNFLSSPIPPELGGLAELRFLNLGSNDLSGPIPPELGELVKLTWLSLSSNNLAGPIPVELARLTDLGSLSLGNNALSGPIPPELGELVKLTWLSLSSNNLAGPIPVELARLTDLESLSLDNNALSGPIPPELGELVKLTWLSLSSNNLAGPIPPELGSLVTLERLYLHRNNLAGPIPESFLALSALGRFRFEGNANLCAPGMIDFVTWLEGIEHTTGPYCNESDVEVLNLLYETAGGPDWTNSGGWLETPALAEWHGVAADSLGHVTELDLTRNGLTGHLPHDLGNLAEMTRVRIGDNALSGRLPPSLSRLSLVELHYTDTDLCAPSDASFQRWLAAIPSHEGTEECAPLTDRDVLEILYDATGGPNWTNNENWLTDAPLRDWYGVWADGEGRVIRLRVYRNNLTGSIPPELGSLDRLQSLGFNLNNLSGSIPSELGNLANLTDLRLFNNQLSGSIPPELGNLANLKTLSIGTNNLTDPIPPELGDLPNLEQLFIGSNPLRSPIPPELGRLANLKRLSIRDAGVTGTIPPELGNLTGLTHMWLWGNELTGPIPPELGNLTSLENAYLGDNELTGPIPPELGALPNLKDLYLNNNALSGPVPPELGNLPSLTALVLDGNALAGLLPPEIGSLSTLEELVLGNNALSGPVPAEFGGMSSLRQLVLTNNPGMEGSLPLRLTELRRLEGLLTEGTDLCAPADPGFQSWLEGVYKRRVPRCVEGDPPVAYLTQAVQSREFPVPLVAGERALLRVFPTARQPTSAGIPPVRARFYHNGQEIHVQDIPGKSGPIPTQVDESSLSKSANAEIPAEVIQPGLEIVIEVDPDLTLDSALGVAKRIPETGRLPVEVKAMPPFDLTLIPFIWSETRDSSIVDLVGAMAANPEAHEMLEETRTLLPVGHLDVEAHEPVVSSSNNAFDLRANAQAIRAMEGGTGHYMGLMSTPVTGAAGVAFIATRVSFSIPFATTIAHELGHNMSLLHAPCGGAGGPDPSYPYPDGSSGAWGYDFRDGGRLVHPRTGRDLMSYCNPRWISDYSFANALRYRLFDEGPPTASAVAASTRSLLLWGWVDAEGELFLEPAFVVDAPPALPDSTGAYQITGRTTGGGEVFSFGFAMPATADGDGSSSFAFLLPVRPEWEGNLASITLSGPDGSVMLDRESDLSMAILRNRRTGQVRGILRDVSPPDAAAMAPQANIDSLDVFFSRGMPDTVAWGR